MSLQPYKVDPELGLKVEEYLKEKGVNTPTRPQSELWTDEQKIAAISSCFGDIMYALGLDMKDDSLNDTPNRFGKMYVKELFWGLDPKNFPKCTAVDNKMHYDEMVCERNVSSLSVCEHHFVTIDGKATVAYIPKKKVLGLSKINRVVEYFSRRPQIQERLTEQIYHALSYILETDDVAVVVDGVHYCVKSRGVEDGGSHTTTSKLGGSFKTNPTVRAEFLSLTRS